MLENEADSSGGVPDMITMEVLVPIILVTVRKAKTEDATKTSVRGIIFELIILLLNSRHHPSYIKLCFLAGKHID